MYISIYIYYIYIYIVIISQIYSFLGVECTSRSSKCTSSTLSSIVQGSYRSENDPLAMFNVQYPKDPGMS